MNECNFSSGISTQPGRPVQNFRVTPPPPPPTPLNTLPEPNVWSLEFSLRILLKFSALNKPSV